MPLPELTDQSQSHIQPQIIPRPLLQHQLVDPTCIGPLLLIMTHMRDLHQNLLI